MTVVAATPLAGPYDGNGATDTFSFTPFVIAAEADIVVTLTSVSGVDTVQTLSVDYTVTPSETSYPSSGTVTMTTPPAIGEKLTLSRSTARSQLVDLQNRKAVNPETLETAYDQLTLIVQELDEEINRSVTLPVSAGLSDLEFPLPSADDVIGWDGTGTSLENKTPNTSAYITMPAGSTDNAIARFDLLTGKALQNSVVTIDDSGIMQNVYSILFNDANTGVMLTVGNDDFDRRMTFSGSRATFGYDKINSNLLVKAAAGLGVMIQTNGVDALEVASGGNVAMGGGSPDRAVRIAGTDAIKLPVGTTAQRPGTPEVGDFRWSTTAGSLEAYDGSLWVGIGSAGGAYRGNNGLINGTSGVDDIIRVHNQTLTVDVTVSATENGVAAGPLEIDSGVTLTVSGNLSVVGGGV